MNPKFSVVTIVKNRHQQLRNLIVSIEKSELLPAELIIVWMDVPCARNTAKSSLLNVKQFYLDGETLPLAKARNRGFTNASENIVIFVDVDCICSPSLFTSLSNALNKNTLISAKPKYLPIVPADGHYDALHSLAISHPKRECLPINDEANFLTFWSLIFAINKTDFKEVGGFDENFTGYGAEDTDFAMRCEKAGLQLRYVNDFVLHQYHAKYDPPINYAKDIVGNANLFCKKWGFLPMMKWLNHMAELNLVSFNDKRDEVVLLREPTENEVNKCLSTNPY